MEIKQWNPMERRCSKLTPPAGGNYVTTNRTPKSGNINCPICGKSLDVADAKVSDCVATSPGHDFYLICEDCDKDETKQLLAAMHCHSDRGPGACFSW